jgi:hypothetical protein
MKIEAALFVLKEENAFWIVDLDGMLLVRTRSIEEDVKQYEIDQLGLPQRRLTQDDLEVEVAYGENEERVQLRGRHALAISAIAC